MTKRIMIYTDQSKTSLNLFTGFFIAALFIAFSCAAQQFGGNPSSLKWQQINTDTARIIFHEDLDETGKRVASVIHELEKMKV